MTNMKKLLALLLAVVLCLSLAACATTPKDTATDTTPADTAADTAKDDAADNTADDSNASEPAAEGGKNIVWAGWSGEEEASKDIFQRMMKTYEDASGNTVTWVGWTWADTAQQLLIRTQGGEQLDLAQADIGIFNTIAAAGVLADWNEILGEDYLKENFEQVPDELYKAARVDGTSDFKYLWKVLIPICRPTIVTIIILKIIECWNSYVWPRLVTDNPDLFLVSNGIQEIRENGFGRENIPAMMAAVVVISVPLIALFLVFRKKIMEGVSRGGMKG